MSIHCPRAWKTTLLVVFITILVFFLRNNFWRATLVESCPEMSLTENIIYKTDL